MKIRPTTVLDFKIAQPADLPLVLEILAEAAAWLAERGIDQWPSPPNEPWRQRMAAAVARGEVVTVGVAKNRFGIARLNWSDPYWPDDGQAGYLHTMAVRRAMHGQNLGQTILFWAVQQVRGQGGQYLRLDCQAGNGRLRRYYEEKGFRYQGEVADRDYTGALYQLALDNFTGMD